MRLTWLIVIIGLMLMDWLVTVPLAIASGGDAVAPIGVANPTAVYCADIGYTYEILSGASGQTGVCKLPGGVVCDAWDFLKGTCGQSHNCCAQLGYETETRSVGPLRSRMAADCRREAPCVKDPSVFDAFLTPS